jgi:predicted RND superfamily exporter protein
MIGLALALGSQLPRLEIDTSTESCLRSDDPPRIGYASFVEQLGNDQPIIIALRPRQIFEPAFIATLQEIHGAVGSEVPFVADVTSLVNVRETRGQ